MSGEQTVADSEQTLADAADAADQTLSDADQTGSDRDQTSADCDQVAADRDQAASDRDLADGGDAQEHARTRKIRQRSARQREQTSTDRIGIAEQRDATADARDVAALARDQAASARDLAMAARDASHEQFDGARALTGAEIVVRAAGQRKRAAQQRAQSAAQRELAAADRAAAAVDREAAARERRQGLLDREAFAALGARGAASRSALDKAYEAYVQMDAGGFITDLNPAAEAVFGWSRAEAIGRVLGDTIVPERLRAQHLAGLQRFLATGEGPVLGKRLQLAAIHRDGHEFPVEITISTTREGDTPSFHAFLHDVSQRVRAEQYRATQHAVTGALAEADTVQAAVPQILRALGEGMGWDVGVYWTPGPTGELCFGEIWQTAGLHLRAFEDACRRLTFAAGAGLPGRVWRDARPVFVADVATDHRLPRRQVAAEAGLHAAVGLALVGRDGVRGVIELFTRELRHPDDELLATLSTLSTQIARFIVILTERQDALERLEALALTDPLTGLANRRAWDEGLARELARAKRHGDALCVAMLDIDAFKAFNDRHGHQAGDDALTATAHGWQAHVRANDLLARYGGEEFALALPAQDLPAALVAVERLRTAMPASVTCSAGLARWTAGESAAELVGRADSALYAAKDAGRNRTVTAA